MRLYHVTPGRNRTSIVINGLVPRLEFGLSGRGRDTIRANCVWLTDNWTYIIRHQGGLTWMDYHKPVIVEVDVSGLELEVHRNHKGEPAPHEWKYFGNISRERILQIIG